MIYKNYASDAVVIRAKRSMAIRLTHIPFNTSDWHYGWKHQTLLANGYVTG